MKSVAVESGLLTKWENYRMSLPKAVMQLAWQPVPTAAVEADDGSRLAVAGEDGSLRVLAL